MTDNINQAESTKSIGGWLLLPAIVFILLPSRNLYIILTAINRLPPERASDPRTWIIGAIEIILIIGFFSIAYLLFKKRRVVIRGAVILMVSFIALEITQLIIKMFQYDQYSLYMLHDLIQACVISAFVIPYFMKSKRVKETFVK